MPSLNRIGPELKEISARIWAREIKISFEELLDKMIDFEILKKQEAMAENIIPYANFAAKKIGHQKKFRAIRTSLIALLKATKGNQK